MPDLSQEACHQFWRDFEDPTIYRVITFMEGQEDWTLDGNAEVEAAISKLATSLDSLGEVELKKEDDFIRLVAHLKTGRGLRLLMSLDQAYPGAATKVLMFAEEKSSESPEIAEMFLQRNMIFERLRLLSRIFSEERFRLICQALEESGYD